MMWFKQVLEIISDLRLKILIERTGAMGVQIILHQSDLADLSYRVAIIACINWA